MKKSLIALAAVAASAAAFVQSSVTVFGVVDAAVSYVDGGTNWSGLASGANSTSRIGFRGVEDLGGGLKANFWLEAGVNLDNGDGTSGFTATSGRSGDGLSFKRRSTVGLEGAFGEVRLGRDQTEAYKITSRYDVFGQVGFGASKVWADADVTATSQNTYTTNQRVSNAITYVSPSFSGFRVAGNYGFGESANGNSDGRYLGLAAGYDNGPLSLGLGLERLNAGNVVPAQGGAALPMLSDINTWSLGGSYNFGVVKVLAGYRDSEAKLDTTGAKSKLKGYYLGLSAPVGAAGEVKASYNRYDRTTNAGVEAKADHFSLGYVHNMSKRTAVYGTYSYLKNKNNGTAFNLSSNATLDNGKQQGLQVGVRHAF